MDVYLPKSKDNKQEHRGFGFVTFETEAAIQRVVSNGAHRLRRSTIAIDIAKVEDDADQNTGSGGRSSFDSATSGPYIAPHASFSMPMVDGAGRQMPMMMQHI